MASFASEGQQSAASPAPSSEMARNPHEVTFHCTFVKSFSRSSKRLVRLDLCKKTLELIYPDKTKKSTMTEFIVNIRKISPGIVGYSVKHGSYQREKRLVFDYEEESSRFIRAIKTLSTAGDQLYSIFAQMDSSCAGVLRRTDMEHVLQNYMRAKYTDQGVDMPEGQEEDFRALVTNMMQLVSTGSPEQGGVAYSDFFIFFSIQPPASVSECLSAWIRKVRTHTRISAANSSRFNQQTPPGAQAAESPADAGSLDRRSVMTVTDETESLGFDLLPGENIFCIEEQVRCSFICHGPHTICEHGTMYVSNFRLVFQAYLSDTDNRSAAAMVLQRVHVPLATMSKVEQGKTDATSLTIMCKDLRQLLLTFFNTSNDKYVAMVAKIINETAFPLAESSGLFAFAYSPEFKGTHWDLFDPVAEYRRQGMFHPITEDDGSTSPSPWRVLDQRGNYSFSPTYPGVLILPQAMSDADLAEAASYRSKRRLPAITYREANTGAVLSRSSQPMAGVQGKRCEADEKLLDLFRTQGELDEELANPSQLHILDCRGQLAATGNQALGKGVENTANYKHTHLTYCNIGNIHTMRGSLEKLADIVLPGEADEVSAKYLTALDDTGWLQHVRLILIAAVNIQQLMLSGCSVLVHCSDGWDRTAQLAATAQILLDPFFRTIEGFAVLIEKDWCSFGFKFQDRCGHGVQPSGQDRSPIFLQWLDAVHQVLLQHPQAFEFNGELLVFLADHVYSCLFGNFLANYEKDRIQLDVRGTCTSVWAYVEAFRFQFVNSLFEPVPGPLECSVSPKRIRLWERYFCRWDGAMHPTSCSEAAWIDDFGSLPLPTRPVPGDAAGELAAEEDALAANEAAEGGAATTEG